MWGGNNLSLHGLIWGVSKSLGILQIHGRTEDVWVA